MMNRSEHICSGKKRQKRPGQYIRSKKKNRKSKEDLPSWTNDELLRMNKDLKVKPDYKQQYLNKQKLPGRRKI